MLLTTEGVRFILLTLLQLHDLKEPHGLLIDIKSIRLTVWIIPVYSTAFQRTFTKIQIFNHWLNKICIYFLLYC